MQETKIDKIDKIKYIKGTQGWIRGYYTQIVEGRCHLSLWTKIIILSLKAMVSYNITQKCYFSQTCNFTIIVL